MSGFKETEFEKYSEEARNKWGSTEAYEEYAKKTKNYPKDKWKNLAAEMDSIMAEFSLCMKDGFDPSSPEAQALVAKLKNHVSDNYYNCTDDILSGLGQMYVADERFKNNIDKHACGTAKFISDAIATFCGK